jgi:hypothetical protein
MLGIITLRRETAGVAEGTVAYTLAAIKDWTFLLGPGWVVGWGSGPPLRSCRPTLAGIVRSRRPPEGLGDGRAQLRLGSRREAVLHDLAGRGRDHRVRTAAAPQSGGIDQGAACPLERV